ncbi:gas vesicle protein GvpG [Streptomyces sp. NPDC059740]|uniref:gas vesicle protein GvpG n=1 Tax=Streptomyces sp. NPDC059740 TaxID=3346926 RepID=UPI00365817F0
MGLISEVLLLPVAPVRAPAKGIGWVLQQVVADAERQYYDPSAIQQELRELSRRLDAGGITEAEFDRQEDELLDRLDEARTRRQTTTGQGDGT